MKVRDAFGAVFNLAYGALTASAWWAAALWHEACAIPSGNLAGFQVLWIPPAALTFLMVLATVGWLGENWHREIR